LFTSWQDVASERLSRPDTVVTFGAWCRMKADRAIPDIGGNGGATP